MVGAIIVSTPLIVIPTSSDLVITTQVGCLQVSTVTTSNTIGEFVLIRG
jgi:hypothetical protein